MPNYEYACATRGKGSRSWYASLRLRQTVPSILEMSGVDTRWLAVR
jgi:hypothetical protein